ncbi:MAG: FKBP-type peptidyl-prolyl cis-trans isomerase [Pseudomonadales bacterium]|nr:FKBP-type peptidyl-prolyl cis-trans isomerase [Pseudomonadales bacterium]
MVNLSTTQVSEAGNPDLRTNIRRASLLFTSLALFSGCAPTALESTNATEQTSASQTVSFADDKAKASYGMGYSLGDNVKRQQAANLDYDAFLLGAKDSLSGSEKRIPEEELKLAFEAFQVASRKKQQQAEEVMMEEGKKFLADAAGRENVVTLASGMLYEVLTEGDGAKPLSTDKVRTHYHGTLMDGTVFDSSVERGEPATFPVNGVIQGWVEALQLMPVGSKWRLYIPPDLAYGARGAGGLIGPNATLVFEVELLEIVD